MCIYNSLELRLTTASTTGKEEKMKSAEKYLEEQKDKALNELKSAKAKLKEIAENGDDKNGFIPIIQAKENVTEAEKTYNNLCNLLSN